MRVLQIQYGGGEVHGRFQLPDTDKSADEITSELNERLSGILDHVGVVKTPQGDEETGGVDETIVVTLESSLPVNEASLPIDEASRLASVREQIATLVMPPQPN